jgi:hypothetical protein
VIKAIALLGRHADESTFLIHPFLLKNGHRVSFSMTAQTKHKVSWQHGNSTGSLNMFPQCMHINSGSQIAVFPRSGLDVGVGLTKGKESSGFDSKILRARFRNVSSSHSL